MATSVAAVAPMLPPAAMATWSKFCTEAPDLWQHDVESAGKRRCEHCGAANPNEQALQGRSLTAVPAQFIAPPLQSYNTSSESTTASFQSDLFNMQPGSTPATSQPSTCSTPQRSYGTQSMQSTQSLPDFQPTAPPGRSFQTQSAGFMSTSSLSGTIGAAELHRRAHRTPPTQRSSGPNVIGRAPPRSLLGSAASNAAPAHKPSVSWYAEITVTLYSQMLTTDQHGGSVSRGRAERLHNWTDCIYPEEYAAYGEKGFLDILLERSSCQDIRAIVDPQTRATFWPDYSRHFGNRSFPPSAHMIPELSEALLKGTTLEDAIRFLDPRIVAKTQCRKCKINIIMMFSNTIETIELDTDEDSGSLTPPSELIRQHFHPSTRNSTPRVQDSIEELAESQRPSRHVGLGRDPTPPRPPPVKVRDRRAFYGADVVNTLDHFIQNDWTVNPPSEEEMPFQGPTYITFPSPGGAASSTGLGRLFQGDVWKRNRYAEIEHMDGRTRDEIVDSWEAAGREPLWDLDKDGLETDIPRRFGTDGSALLLPGIRLGARWQRSPTASAPRYTASPARSMAAVTPPMASPARSTASLTGSQLMPDLSAHRTTTPSKQCPVASHSMTLRQRSLSRAISILSSTSEQSKASRASQTSSRSIKSKSSSASRVSKSSKKSAKTAASRKNVRAQQPRLSGGQFGSSRR